MHDTLTALLLLLWGLLMGYALRTWHDEERRSRARQRRHTAALNRLAATPPRTPSFDLAAPKRRTTYTAATNSHDLDR